jgi:hypothetical protein
MITDYDNESAARAVPDSDLQILPRQGQSPIYRVRTGADRSPENEPTIVIPARQFWVACLDLGYLPAIQAMRGTLTTREQLIMDSATDFDRTNPVFSHFAAKLGVSDEQVRALYRYAETLP